MHVSRLRLRSWWLALFTVCLNPITLPAQLALIRQGDESVGMAEPDDWHGWAVALGDFNNDGHADLATGAPLEKTGSEVFTSGLVIINPGSPYGLTWNGAHALSVIDGGLDPAANHQMGRALAAGDFNGDGYDDLAVGLPASTVNGESAAGRVLVYYGGPTGLPGSASIIHEGMLGALVENGDLFGSALAAGRLGDDAYDDLVIAATGENGGRGAVFVIRGGPLGLQSGTTQILLGEDLGFPNQPGDAFGSAIAIGNIVGFSGAELIVGAPFAELTPSAPSSGIVYIANSSDGSVSTNATIITPLTVDDQPFNNGRFGAALCVGNFWGDGGTLDLAIGAPGAHTGGRVYIGRGTPLGIAWLVTLHQKDADEEGDDFGSALAAGDLRANGFDELAVGAPGEDFELAFFGDDTGSVYIFPGGPDGPSQADAEIWWTIDLGDPFFERAWLGHSLAAGRTSASARHSFVAGAPRRDDDRGQVFDIAPWRQVTRLLCQSAVAADCEGNVVYALRPFERVKVASTTKIMTVLLGCEATERPLNDPLRVELQESYAIEQWMYEAYLLTSGCSLYGFTPLPEVLVETYTFEDLLYACIFPSGNDASYAIADAMTMEIDAWGGLPNPAQQFVDLMNARAATIGMQDTFFTNPAGTDPGDPYSTAYDMWLLAKTAMANPLFREIVGSTSHIMDKILPGDEAGIFQTATINLSYGWLNAMKNRDSRIVGLKPGSTPGAKSTGVVAAQFDAAGNKLAYATGFRWLDSTYGRDKLAALVQLGLAFCNTDIETPDGLSPAPTPKGSSPLARGTFDYAAPVPTCIQFGSFEDAEPDPQNPAIASDSLGVIDLRAFNHGTNAATAGIRWQYRALWAMAPGTRAGLRITPVIGGKVRLHLPVEEGVTQATASLRLSGTLHPGFETIVLPPDTDLYPAVWDDFSIGAGPVELIIDNVGSDTIFLSLDGVFKLEMVLAGAPGEQFHARLEPLMASVRTGHLICRGDATNGTPPGVELIVENRQDGGRFVPPVEIVRFDRQLSGRSEHLELDFAAVDWEGPLDPFIKEFLIESTDSLGSNIWQSLDLLPAEPTSFYQWQAEEPPQEHRFLRVRTVALPEE